MRRAALSPNALRLPSAGAPVKLEIVHGRQTVVRQGMFFKVIGKFRRSCYMQLDGSTVLADECKCEVKWLDDPWGGGFALPVSFTVVRKDDCPIDEHQILLRKESR